MKTKNKQRKNRDDKKQRKTDTNMEQGIKNGETEYLDMELVMKKIARHEGHGAGYEGKELDTKDMGLEMTDLTRRTCS